PFGCTGAPAVPALVRTMHVACHQPSSRCVCNAALSARTRWSVRPSVAEMTNPAHTKKDAMGIEPAKPAKLKLLLAFATIYILWGSPSLAMRLAIDTLPPFLMAGTRFLAAGTVLYIFSARAGAPRPTIRQWRNSALDAVGLFVVGNGGVAWAQQHVP